MCNKLQNEMNGEVWSTVSCKFFQCALLVAAGQQGWYTGATLRKQLTNSTEHFVLSSSIFLGMENVFTLGISLEKNLGRARGHDKLRWFVRFIFDTARNSEIIFYVTSCRPICPNLDGENP